MQYTNNHNHWQILITSSGQERSVAPNGTIELPGSFTEICEIIDCNSFGLGFNR